MIESDSSTEVTEKTASVSKSSSSSKVESADSGEGSGTNEFDKDSGDEFMLGIFRVDERQLIIIKRRRHL